MRPKAMKCARRRVAGISAEMEYTIEPKVMWNTRLIIPRSAPGPWLTPFDEGRLLRMPMSRRMVIKLA